MVSSKSLLTVSLLLLSSSPFSSASPSLKNLDTNTGPIIKVKVEINGVIGVSHAPAGKKRGTYEYGNYSPPLPPPTYEDNGKNLLDLLKAEKQQGFCKAYINLSPVVVKTVTVPICGVKNPKCTPVTVTKVVGVTQTITGTVAADTPTVTNNVIVSTTMITTPTITVTSTVSMPPTEPPATTVGPVKRGVSLPQCLKRYSPDKISSACSVLITTLIHTTTKTITRPTPGIPITKTTTSTTTLATNTVTVTTTPPAVSVTQTISTTTVSLTADTVTVTTTVCPSATHGISGISVNSPGRLEVADSPNVVGCCTACFNAPGCQGWAFLGTGYCFYAVGGAPNSGATTPQCPSGKGGFSLFPNGPAELAGGPGQCFSG